LHHKEGLLLIAAPARPGTGDKVISGNYFERSKRASLIVFDTRLTLAPSPVRPLPGQQGHFPTRATFEVHSWRWFEKFAMTCNGLQSRHGQGFTPGRRSATLATAAAAQHATSGLGSRRGASAACFWRDPDATAWGLAARAVTLSVHPVDEVHRMRWFATDCNDLQTSPDQRLQLPARWDSPVGSATGNFQKYADADLLRQ